jgi:hypothetical protein
LVALLASVAACHGARPAAPPVPEIEPVERGTAAAAAAVSPEDRLSIYTVIARNFFRPSGGQARWIDPRPLGHVRDPRADSLVASDIEWADGVREAIGHERICVLGMEDDGCRGRRGSLLRFSPVYADGDESARVFVRLIPVFEETPDAKPDATRFEIVFTMARSGRAWRIARERTVRTR